MKWRSDYSNTKVKTRNLLTNVSYGRFKQSGFHNQSFIVDILSFLLQNFSPVNLDIKLGIERERDMVKFIWDECIPHEFVSFIYKEKNYNEITCPNMTYQKANNIVKEYLFQDMNRINHLKYNMEEKFDLIHYVYSLLFSKIYNRTNNFGIQRKNNFDFNFQTWRKGKMQKSLKPFSPKVDTIVKDPTNYEAREVEKHEHVPINFSLNDDQSPTMVFSVVDGALKKQTEKRKILEKRLEENTVRMNKIKKK